MPTETPLFEADLHEYVIQQLEAARGEWPVISKETEVPYDTITKIVQRQIVDPKVSKLQKLANYFRAREQAAA